ncbi:MAG: 50S ribosomal protein L9 [Alphaproteobacteria bacterium]
MMISVVLCENVKKLGKIGEIVRVRSGYARNFLLPQKKVLRASEENLKLFEKQRSELEALNLKKLKDAEELAVALKAYVITMVRQAGESGQLYGSITAKDIAQAFEKEDIAVKKEHVVLDAPLKAIGHHTIRLALHSDVLTTISLIVAQSSEEADLAKQKLLRASTPKEEEVV